MTGLLQDAILRQTDPSLAMVRSGHNALRKNNFEEARVFFDRAIALRPLDPGVHLMRASTITYLDGNILKLFKELDCGVKKVKNTSLKQGLNMVKLKILGDDFGGMHATVFDGLLKLKKLGVIEADYIVIIRESAVGNLAYLNCWRKHLPIIITNDNNYAAVKSLLSPIFEEISAIQTVMGILPLYEALNLGLNNWGDSQPLLELTDAQRYAGDRILESVGISPGSWFAGLHVREGAKGGIARSGPDADISTYDQAIKMITNNGGWVIRMGIGGTPIGPMDHLWDYANSEHQSDWMDVYLWGSCRFFVGTSSGPSWVPPSFGKPVLLTNATTLGLTLNFSNSLLIPKLLWSKSKARFLTFREIFEGPYAWSVRPDYDEGDVTMVSNTPEELALAVKEMMALVDNPAQYLNQTKYQKMLDDIRIPYAKVSQAKVVDCFLKTYSNLLN